MTVETLFGALAGTESVSGREPQKETSQAAPASNRGLALLDTIFATATPPPDLSHTNGMEQNASSTSIRPFLASATSKSTPPQQSHNSAESNNDRKFPPPSQSHDQALQTLQHTQRFNPKSSFYSSSSPTHPESHSESHRESHPSDSPVLSSRNVLMDPAPSVPQVLTEDVIFSLLGLCPDPRSSQSFTHSRSSSTSTTSSRLSRYSGDAEDEDESGPADSDAFSGYSRPSTGLDTDTDIYEEVTAADGSDVQPLSQFPHNPQGVELSALPRVNGDVTPRAPWRGAPVDGELSSGVQEYIPAWSQSGELRTSTPPPPDRNLSYSPERPSSSHHSSPSPSKPPSSCAVDLFAFTDTLRSSATKTGTLPSALPDFSQASPGSQTPPSSLPKADSELWPDSRVPIDDRAFDEDADIVELDFADTSALSDAEAFMNKIKERENTRKAPASTHFADQSFQGKNGRTPREGTYLKDKGSKANPNAMRQDSIPVARRAASSTQAELTTKTHVSNNDRLPTSTPPSRVSVPPANDKAQKGTEATDNTPRNHSKLDRVNSAHGAATGRVTVNGQGVGISREAIQQSLLAVASSGRSPNAMERNEFVREVLTLVHVSLVLGVENNMMLMCLLYRPTRAS